MKKYSLFYIILTSCLMLCFLPRNIYSYDRKDLEMVRNGAVFLKIMSSLRNDVSTATNAEIVSEIVRSATDDENQKLLKDLFLDALHVCGIALAQRERKVPDEFANILRPITESKDPKLLQYFCIEPSCFLHHCAKKSGSVVDNKLPVLLFMCLALRKIITAKLLECAKKCDYKNYKNSYFAYRVMRGGIIILVDLFLGLTVESMSFEYAYKKGDRLALLGDFLGYFGQNLLNILMKETFAGVIGESIWDADQKKLKTDVSLEKDELPEENILSEKDSSPEEA